MKGVLHKWKRNKSHFNLINFTIDGFTFDELNWEEITEWAKNVHSNGQFRYLCYR